jgi:hypothetical protein
MNNSKQKLNTVILRGMVSTISRINPEDLNEEGRQELHNLKVVVDELGEVLAYHELVELLEEQEVMRGH